MNSAGATAEKESRAKTGVLESFNPATGELVGEVATIKPGQVQGIVDDVAKVQPAWAELRLEDRAEYMRRAAAVLVEQAEDIAQLLSTEQGKPIAESYTMEVLPTIDALNWCADDGPGILAPEKVGYPQPYLLTKRSHFVYEPIGVVGVIGPWNYPWSIPFGEAAIALMAGNGVVLKPASLTPLLGEAMRDIFEKAGFPQGLLQTVHGGGKIGDALVKSSADKIFFTGSVDVGRKVGVECAKLLKGSVLELGGKDPMIVCSDADLEMAVDGALWGGFANAGQTCSGIERVYVMEDVAERFIEGLVRGASRLTVGDPLSPDTEIGPMTSEEQYELVGELVDDAVAAGAELRCGGPVDPALLGSSNGGGAALNGKYWAPTVLTGVTHRMRIMKEEIFGPVVPVVTVGSEDEAVRCANDSEFGLGASVWTRDRARGERISTRLESGMVWINDHSFTHAACQCSWGGVKHSGVGRSHSKFGFYECVNIKLRTWEPGMTRNFWWHPYDRSMVDAVRASARIVYGKGSDRFEALRDNALPLLKMGGRSVFKRR